MESIIIYPTTKKQQNVLKSLLQEMKINFQIDDTQLTEEAFFAKVDKAKQQAKAGRVTRLAKKDQKAFLGL